MRSLCQSETTVAAEIEYLAAGTNYRAVMMICLDVVGIQGTRATNLRPSGRATPTTIQLVQVVQSDDDTAH